MLKYLELKANQDSINVIKRHIEGKMVQIHIMFEDSNTTSIMLLQFGIDK